MKRAAVLLLVLVSMPAAAGDWSILATGHWLEKSGEDELEGVLGVNEADFDFEAGPGIGAGFLWQPSTQWAVELKASFARMGVEVRTRTTDAIFILDLGSVDVIPLTAILQYRPDLAGDWDPYLGAGVAHVLFDDLSLEGSDQSVRFDSDTGLALAAGLDVALSDRWFLNFDLKYVPFETGSAGESRFGTTGDVRLEPLLASAGVRYRF